MFKLIDYIVVYITLLYVCLHKLLLDEKLNNNNIK
jgi:hypothetical protein